MSLTATTVKRPGDVLVGLRLALEVVEVFTDGRSEYTQRDIARATGFNDRATSRFLHTLVEAGWLAVDTDESDRTVYALTPWVIDLALAALRGMGWHDNVAVQLHALAQATGLDATVWVPAPDRKVVCFAHQRPSTPARGGLRPDLEAGIRRDADTSAPGLALSAGNGTGPHLTADQTCWTLATRVQGPTAQLLPAAVALTGICEPASPPPTPDQHLQPLHTYAAYIGRLLAAHRALLGQRTPPPFSS